MTGGAGFIGSHIVDALVDAGAEVLVVDDLSRGTRTNLESALGHGARLVEFDVCDAEHYARWFRRTRGLDVVTLRYGNVYGPRQDPRGDAGVIAIFCDRVLAGRRPIVYGDGRQTRDYVYVLDIAAANIATACAGELAHGEYNVGTGTEVSVLELAQAVAAAAGVDAREFEPDFAPARPGELVRSCLDVTRARRDLRLAQPTPLSEGLARTLKALRAP